MTKNKRIATIECCADLRSDTCPLQLGHEFEMAPIEKCIQCKYSKTVYTKRGGPLKNRLLSQKKSWDKQFGNHKEVEK